MVYSWYERLDKVLSFCIKLYFKFEFLHENVTISQKEHADHEYNIISVDKPKL